MALRLEPQSYRRQVELPEGSRVQIVGSEGDKYLIEPPPGAVAYIAASSVERIDADGNLILDEIKD